MGIRGFIKDVLSMYVAVIIIISIITNNYDKIKLLVSALLLLFFSTWFMLERFGIIEKSE
ncbi:MAG: hypothetical protein OH319_03660 [Candidatus Parvarchaeota archaeon]|nr:hypothetical protein [Candidatus Jingweiarchaeum tengchongense]MCW1298577.1 hypothetical protein [Candidatus Jingweiarchaeum tengchongense]MCW1300423.1 hypothetical protein [Candidatus Jingweiarchaeum tengchongense]MCW1304601.1 hypothetical protein [Candidatus Jingweiarchaeum tengchongense]MCW1306089.1 hypothetical protein [Candidatus Jingweiarchaeum tengchongense]